MQGHAQFSSPPNRVIDSEELATHQREGDLWVAVRGKVYDVSEFINRHPGGVAILKAVAGKDVTAEFDSYHAYLNADAWLRTRCVGFYRHTKSEAGPRLLFAPPAGSSAPPLYVGAPPPVLNQPSVGSLSDSDSNSYVSSDED